MQFPNIVALIDARIALLQQVRDLLTTPSAGSPAPPSRRETRQPLPAQVSKGRESKTARLAPSESSPVAEAPPQVTRLPFAGPRARSAARQKPVSSETQSALAGKPPAGPVAISAAKVQAEQAQRQTAERVASPMAEERAAEPDEILRKWRLDQHAENAS